MGTSAYHYEGYLSYPTDVTSDLPITEVQGPVTFAASWSPIAPLVLSVSCGKAIEQSVGTSSASLTVSPSTSSCVLSLTEQAAISVPIEYQVSVSATDSGLLHP